MKRFVCKNYPTHRKWPILCGEGESSEDDDDDDVDESIGDCDGRF